MENTLQREKKQSRPLASLEEEVLLNLYRASDHFHRAFEQAIKPYGLTPAQYNVLHLLRDADEEGLRCSEIASQQISQDPDVTRLLDRLARQKLVRRRRGSSDRRIVLTHITEAGLAKLREVESLVDANTRSGLKHLTREQLKQLIQLLEAARLPRAVAA